MKTIRIFSFAIIAALFITSCDWYSSHTVIGTGDPETMEISVPEFTGVSVTGACNVDVQIGAAQHVELSAQPQVLDVMTYEVRNGILQIGFKKGYNVRNSKEIAADIVIPELSYVAVTGAGDYKLQGTIQEFLDINITGTGNVNAFDLEVEECTIQISGSGNCEVHVNNMLDVYVSGAGNVFYKGNPTIASEISGVGNVTDVNGK
jgi:hypothetical protein